MISPIDLEIMKHTVIGVLGGCCANVYTLELLISESNNASVIITFCQFLAVMVFGMVLNMQIVRRGMIMYPILNKPKIPIKVWIIPSMIFSTVSLLNNLALEYDIPLPLHIVIRSASLPMSLILGYLVSGKRVCLARTVSVILVSIGICLYTYISLSQGNILTLSDFKVRNLSLRQILGISMLVLTIVLFGVVSLIQEKIYKKYGKHWKEGLLYLHLYGILQFLLYKDRIVLEYSRITSSEQINILSICSILKKSGLVSILSIPRIWLYLIFNSLTQVMCVVGVNGLTSTVGPVTLNLILTLRKFTSLILSVLFFKNAFTLKHFITAVMVVVGTVAYSVCKETSNSQEVNSKKKE